MPCLIACGSSSILLHAWEYFAEASLHILERIISTPKRVDACLRVVSRPWGYSRVIVKYVFKMAYICHIQGSCSYSEVVQFTWCSSDRLQKPQFGTTSRFVVWLGAHPVHSQHRFRFIWRHMSWSCNSGRAVIGRVLIVSIFFSADVFLNQLELHPPWTMYHVFPPGMVSLHAGYKLASGLQAWETQWDMR